MDQQLRQLYHQMVFIIGEEVNHLMEVEPQVLQSIRNYYLIIAFVMIFIDFYIKILIINNWIISTIITVWFAYYINYKYFSKLLAIILSDLSQKFLIYANIRQSYKSIYFSALYLILIINIVILYSIKRFVQKLSQFEFWNNFDIYLLIFWFNNKINNL